jgi:hypothetical protein
MASSKSNRSRADVIELFDGYDWNSIASQMDVFESALRCALDASENEFVSWEAGFGQLPPWAEPVNLEALAEEPPEIRSVGIAILLRAIAEAYKGEVKHVGNRYAAEKGSPADVLAAFATVRK